MGLIQTVIGMVDLSSFRHGYFLCALRILWLSLFAQVFFFSKALFGNSSEHVSPISLLCLSQN